MSLVRRLDTLSTPMLARRLIDGVFVLALAGGIWLAVATGMPRLLVAGIVVAAVTVEYLLSHRITRDIVASLEADAGGSDDSPVDRLVGTLAADLGIEPPRVVVADDGGVTVLNDGAGHLLTVPDDLGATLDEDSLRGILAHELAHVSLGHLRQVPLREVTRTVVGVAVFWAAFLDGVSPSTALFLGSAYFIASVSRSNPVNRAFHVAGSLGVSFLLGVLAAWASRLEELEADDVAVDATSPRSFAAGLYHVGAATETGDGVTGQAPFEGRRTLLKRLTSPYPTIESRLARIGVAPEDVAGPADAETTAVQG